LKIYVIVSFNDLIFDLPDCNVQFLRVVIFRLFGIIRPNTFHGDVMIRKKMRPRFIALKCRCESEEFDAWEISHIHRCDKRNSAESSDVENNPRGGE